MLNLSFLSWALRIIAAIILGQTLFFKFSGAEESRYIFSTLGMEPWGRYAVGVSELVVVILLLIPRTAWLGGLMGLGVIAGALFFHLTKLGIAVQGDGGTLFYLALAVFVCCMGVVWLHRGDIRAVIAEKFEVCHRLPAQTGQFAHFPRNPLRACPLPARQRTLFRASGRAGKQDERVRQSRENIFRGDKTTLLDIFQFRPIYIAEPRSALQRRVVLSRTALEK